MLEKDIERRMCNAFRAKGAMPLKMEAIVAGLPDRLVVLPGGRVVWVELKTETGRLRPVQEIMIRRLRSMGHTVFVPHGLEEALAVVEEVMPDEVHPE